MTFVRRVQCAHGLDTEFPPGAHKIDQVSSTEHPHAMTIRHHRKLVNAIPVQMKPSKRPRIQEEPMNKNVFEGRWKHEVFETRMTRHLKHSRR